MSSTTFVVDLTGGAVVDNTPQSVNLGVSLQDGIISQSPQPNRMVTAGVSPTPEPYRGRLDQLDDVVEAGSRTTGMTLVYDADTDKYVVKALNMDGGSF
jgi:hypothetical protein